MNSYLAPKVLTDLGIIGNYLDLASTDGVGHSHSHTCTPNLLNDSDSDTAPGPEEPI